MPQHIPVDKRQEIRKWYFKKSLVTIADTARMFRVSETSVKKYLRSSDIDIYPSSRLRNRPSQHSQIEAVLCSIYEHQVGFRRSTDLIKAAKTAWARTGGIDHGMPFLKSFVQRWKLRFNVATDERPKKSEVEAELLRIISAIEGRDPYDIYAMTDIRLFLHHSGMLQEEPQVLIVLGTNVTGTDRLMPTVVGNVADDETSTKASEESLGVRWETGLFASLPPTLLFDLLQSFYKHVSDRKVLLLLPSAYKPVAEDSHPPENITVCSFPFGKDDLHPLHRGPTDDFRIKYRMAELTLMDIFCQQNSLEPYFGIHFTDQIRCLAQAWKDVTIRPEPRKGLNESTTSVRHFPYRSSEFVARFRRIQQAGVIHESLSPKDFMYPKEEHMPQGEYILERVIDWVFSNSEREAHACHPPSPASSNSELENYVHHPSSPESTRPEPKDHLHHPSPASSDSCDYLQLCCEESEFDLFS